VLRRNPSELTEIKMRVRVLMKNLLKGCKVEEGESSDNDDCRM